MPKKEDKSVKEESNLLKLIETLFEGAYRRNDRIMGALDELAAKMQDLDADVAGATQWVADQLTDLKGQIAELVQQVADLQDTVENGTVDAEQVAELSALVDKIDASVEAIDDEAPVEPAPEEPVPDEETIV